MRAPVLAVSPIVGGRAVKGPTAKMMRELGLEVSAATVADRYRDLLDGYVVDEADGAGVAGVARVPCTRPDDKSRRKGGIGARRAGCGRRDPARPA